jgi:hypothetical protein
MKKLLLIVLVAGACNNKPAVPKNILPQQKMQAIMLDLIHVDGRIANAPPADSLIRLDSSRYRMYQQVLALHGTNKEAFKKSLHYYEQHPPLLKETIDSMEKTLDRQLLDTSVNIKKAPPKAL